MQFSKFDHHQHSVIDHRKVCVYLLNLPLRIFKRVYLEKRFNYYKPFQAFHKYYLAKTLLQLVYTILYDVISHEVSDKLVQMFSTYLPTTCYLLFGWVFRSHLILTARQWVFRKTYLFVPLQGSNHSYCTYLSENKFQ